MRRIRVVPWALAVWVLSVAAGSPRALAASTPVIIGGLVTEGEVVGHDDQGFDFKLKDTGDVVRLRWKDLAPVERDRIQKLVGYKPPAPTDAPGAGIFAEGADPATNGGAPARVRFKGNSIEIIEIAMRDSGRVLRGVELADRETPDALFIKNKTTPVFRVQKKLIKSIRRATGNEVDFFGAEELYHRRKARLAPASARDEYELGLFCVDLALPQRAREHFERAIVYDERYAERIGPQLEKVKKLANQVEARKIYSRAMQQLQIRNYAAALRAIEEIEMAYPDSEWTTRLTGMRPQVTENRERQLRKAIITSYYRWMDTFCSQAVHNKITDGEEIPGKIVTLKNGRNYIGVLKSESEDMIILKEWDWRKHAEGDTEYQIDRSQVIRVTPTNLNKKKRMRTYEESKAYVTDTDGGISADIRSGLAREFKIAEEEVKKFWEGRLARVHRIGPGGKVETSTRYISYREAYYGKGTWLREGTRAVSWGPRRTTTNQRGGGRRGRRGQQATMVKTPSKDAETDPEIWWRYQPFDVRANILKAICAEAIMDVVRLDKVPCTVCGGKGKLITFGASTGQDAEPCPHCRGLKSLVKIIFR